MSVEALEARVIDHYASPGSASRYRGRWSARRGKRFNDWWERRMVKRLLAQIPGGGVAGTALDMPSGFGRLYDVLRGHAPRVVESDVSADMLGSAREGQSNGALGYVCGSGVDLPFVDRAFALVLSVRLAHHLHDARKRLRYVRELFRITDEWLIFTFSDAECPKQRRDLWRKPNGSASRRATLKRSDIQAVARESGFEIVGFRALAPHFSVQHFATARRIGAATS